MIYLKKRTPEMKYKSETLLPNGFLCDCIITFSLLKYLINSQSNIKSEINKESLHSCLDILYKYAQVKIALCMFLSFFFFF